jgi:predicted dehydrogenase
MRATRLAVIGVGALGQHHARLLASMPDVDVVGIVDINTARAQEVAAKYAVPVAADAASLIGRIDGVSIATPTVTHVDVALPFLRAGIATLIEKPLASSLEAADRLLDAARQSGARLATGHTERFNPAVEAARPLVSAPRFVEVHRLGTFPERSLDIDVIFDLMIHDLDVLMSLVGSDVVNVEAVGVNVLTPKVDIANARLRFASGCIANLTASRISRDRVRKARFFQHDAYISIDYAAQELEVYRLAASNGGRPSIQGGRIDVPTEEPLRRELADFVGAIRDRRPPAVTGEAGRASLALAARVAELIKTS